MTIILICICAPSLLAIGFFAGRIYEANRYHGREIYPDYSHDHPNPLETRK